MSSVRILLLSLLIFTFAGTASAASRVFADGWEAGNTNQWLQDDYRNRCTVVSTTVDGSSGPKSGSKMAQCSRNGGVAWNNPASFETLVTPASIPRSNELFFRVWIRFDQDAALPPEGYNEKTFAAQDSNGGISSSSLVSVRGGGNSLRADGDIGGNQFKTYWGSSGDSTAVSGTWHKLEYYFNRTAGTVRVWHNGKLVTDQATAYGNAYFDQIYLLRNFSNPHDGSHHTYFDDFEVFSDQGSGAAGNMADATISATPGTVAPLAPTDIVVD